MKKLTPVTRKEKYLAKLAGQDVQIPPPVTREECFLAAICGEEIETPEPATREECFLEDWLESSREEGEGNK